MYSKMNNLKIWIAEIIKKAFSKINDFVLFANLIDNMNFIVVLLKFFSFLCFYVNQFPLCD